MVFQTSMPNLSEIPSNIIKWAIENPAKAKGYALLAYGFIMGMLLYLEGLPNSIKFLIVIYFIAGILLIAGLICVWRDKFLWGLGVKLSFEPIRDITLENLYANGEKIGQAKYVRVKVTNTKKETIKCTASLSNIEDLSPFSGHISKSLVWKQTGRSEEISIPYKASCHFDIVIVDSINNKLLLTPEEPSTAALENIKQVHSGNLSSEPYKIGVEFNGKWDEIKGFNP
jgi:hypothetical protein